MDETQLRATLRSLQDQIDTLSAELGQVTQETAVTEVDLPAFDAVPPADQGRVRWLRVTDGAVVAGLYTYSSPDGPEPISELRLDGLDPGDGNPVETNVRAIYEDSNEFALVKARGSGAGSQVQVATATAGVGTVATLQRADLSSDFVRKNSWLAAHSLPCEITTEHVGAATPTGGASGDVKLGDGVIWVNDAGTWKSVAVA